MLSIFAKLYVWLTTGVKRRYGVKRGRYNPSDPHYEPSAEVLASMPGTTDLRNQDVDIEDQEQLGSCTAFGWLGFFAFVCKKLYNTLFVGSHLQLYYEERVIDGTASEDAGAEVADGATVLSTKGVCPESEWPYDISKFAEQAPAQCYTD